MSTTQPYKTYQRGQRIQNTNISFAKGMNFTSASLADGYARLLVNFDFGGEDTTIVPRSGLLTTGEGLCQYTDIPLPYAEDIVILAGNKVTHDGVEYKQIILGRAISQVTNELWVGDAWVVTYNPLGYNNDPNKTLAYSWLSDPSFDSTYKVFFYKNSVVDTEIHGVQVSDTPYANRHIGAFAFNGDYYYFTNDGKLRHTVFNEQLYKYSTEVVTPFVITQAESQNSLYNMLLSEPYEFVSQRYSGQVFKMTGFAPHEIKREVSPTASLESRIGNLKIRPNNGEEYIYKMYYMCPNSQEALCFHIEYNTGDNSVWHTVARDESQEYSIQTDPITGMLKPLLFDGIRIDSTYAQFRIFAVNKSNAEFNEMKQLTELALVKGSVLTTAFNFVGRDSADSISNLELKRYDLAYAHGLTYWKSRLFVFGAMDRSTRKIDNTILMASDPNRPDWFPYTANADIFDEEIIALQPMLDELLVFTAHNLYSLTLSQDGLSWTKKHLQSDLNISMADLALIRVVKNMVFFKSGNYYYMVVPKLTSTSGTGLAIAPVSKNINLFLDNFLPNVKTIVDDLYNYSLYNRYRNRAKTTIELNLIHYYNYLDYEDVHNVYLFEATKLTKKGCNSETGEYTYEEPETVLMNFSLLYNTVNRTWRIYISESDTKLQPLFMNATGKGNYAALTAYNGYACLQFFEYSNTVNRDSYIKFGENKTSPAVLFRNWQYFDSGNMEQNPDMKKRFREYQFKINNEGGAAIEFYTGFFIDKLTRTYEMQYGEELIDSEEGEEVQTSTIVIDAMPKHTYEDDSSEIASFTKLGSWVLGRSLFPNVNMWKVRIPTSGKGYLPRTILISYNETDFEILSHATVYRQLYSR